MDPISRKYSRIIYDASEQKSQWFDCNRGLDREVLRLTLTGRCTDQSAGELDYASGQLRVSVQVSNRTYEPLQ